MTYFYEALYSD
jgi:hypothetical protein